MIRRTWNLTKSGGGQAWAAFLLTAVLLGGLYACFGLFPFGDKTLSWGDMNQQVLPLLMDFQDILRGESGFFLNLQNAGGMDFFGVFFFFLSSPFSFLALLVEKGDFYYLANVLVLLKLSLAGACAAWFFQRQYPGLPGAQQLFLALSYGLCGYGMLYYQNLIWLDVLCLFPLLMLGLCRLLEEGKPLLFLLVLAAVLVVNYYLSYMVLLALVLCCALFAGICLPRQKRGEAAGLIGACALGALLLTAVVWLPSLLQCLRSARTSASLLENLQAGGFFTRWTTTLPMLVCTAGAACAPFLWRSFPPTPRRKALLLSFALTGLPLLIEPVNKVWHTGSYQAFPARYGYIPLFFALWYLADVLADPEIAAFQPLRRRGQAVAPGVFLAASGVLAGVLLLFYRRAVSRYTATLWIDIPGFLALCGVGLLAALAVGSACLLRRNRQLTGRALSAVLLGACLVQGGFHAALFLGSPAHVPQREQAMLALAPIDDPGLYRVKLEEKFCDVNLLGAMGYPTLNHYTSLTDETFLHTVKALGYSSYWMETSGSCGTKITDLLLSHKYALSRDLTWTPAGGGNLGYLAPAGALPEALDSRDRFAVQDQLYQSLTGDGEGAFRRYRPQVLQGVSLEQEGAVTSLTLEEETGVLTYEISVGEEECLYFDAFRENTARLKEDINDSFQVMVNGEVVEARYPSQRCNGILELGTFSHCQVTVEVVVSQSARLYSFGVCGLDRDKVERLRGSLQEVSLGFSGGRVAGRVAGEEGKSLFLSIPDSPGLRVTVDGKPARPRTVMGCFLEIPLPPGEHQVEVALVPPGLYAGLALSLCGAGLSFACWRLSQSGGAAVWKQRWNRVSWPLLAAAFGGEILLLYLGPVLVWILGQW